VRIAVISDIHGNFVALEAVLADIEKQDVYEVWCGGDIAWGGPRPRDCIARVRDAAWPTVRGNTDVWVTGDPQTVSEPEDRRLLTEIGGAHGISDDDAQWLINLPIGHSGPGSLLLVHGTPTSPFIGPMPDAPASEFLPYEGQANIVVFGHVHHAFVRRLADGTIVCNTGSVGLPMDGDAASYLLIDQVGPDWVLRHRRVSFDREAVIAEAREMDELLRDRFLESFGDR
jgi:predicted phosphodiesterase